MPPSWLASVGNQPLAQSWLTQAAALHDAINRDFWSEARGLYLDGETPDGKVPERTGAVTNYKMIWAGAATPSREKRILSALFPRPDQENTDLWVGGEGVYLKHFASEVLFERGLWQQAFTSWRGFYGSMMKQNRTIPEIWDRSWAQGAPMTTGGTPAPDNQLSDPAVKSLVHPFGIGPMWHLLHQVCGFKPLHAGFSALLWEPMPGDLEFIDASMPVPEREGYFHFSLRRTPSGTRELELTLPGDTEVEVSGAISIRTTRRGSGTKPSPAHGFLFFLLLVFHPTFTLTSRPFL